MRRSASVVAVGLMVACGYGPTGGSTGSGHVRFFHAAADVGAVTFEAGEQSVAGVVYGSVTRSVTVEAGGSTIRVMAGSTPLVTTSLTVADQSRLVVVLSRRNGQLDLAAAVDTGQARTDRANLRLISAPEAPRTVADSSVRESLLGVYVTPPGAGLESTSPLLTMETQVPSYSSFLYFEPGDLLVRYVRAGTTTVVAQAGPVNVAAGEARAVVITRAADGSYRTRVESVPETP